MKTKRINNYNDSPDAYLKRIAQIPMLTFDEEITLADCIKNGDQAARQKLIESNLGLVVKIARSYKVKGGYLMDLIQEGSIGLIYAVDKYQSKNHVRFSTYAAWWIRLSISRYISLKFRTIKIPLKKTLKLRSINHAYDDLGQQYMRRPTFAEIAGELGISKQEVENALNISRDAVSLNMIYGGGESDSHYDIEDFTYNPEQILIKKNMRFAALQMLNHLIERERRVIICRYQLNGEKRCTLKNLSSKMKLSYEAVRQIEIKALRKLQIHADELLQCMAY